jgi:hypothetical protein
MLESGDRAGRVRLQVAEHKGPTIRGRPPEAQPEAADVLRQLVGHNTQAAGSF